VDGGTIYANSALLMAQSEHFRALFSGGMKESTEKGSKRIIKIPKVSYDAFEMLIEFFYSAELRTHMLTEDMFIELFGLAD